jgi:hypothetical protein
MRQDSALSFRCEHCRADKPLHWRVRFGVARLGIPPQLPAQGG